MNVIELITLPFLTNYSNSLIGGRLGFGLDISPCLHCFESNARQQIMTLKKTHLLATRKQRDRVEPGLKY